MAVIDDAISDYLKSLGVAEDEFIKDVQQMEEDGLSTAEILAALSLLDLTTYFLEDLGMSAAINTQMQYTEKLLDDLPFFGSITEPELVALQNVQRSTITKYTSHVGELIRQEIITGRQLGLSINTIKDRLERSINLDRIDNVIATSLTNYQQQVIYAMTSDTSEDQLFYYDGPLDKKTRPLCRAIIAIEPFTREQLESSFPGAFYDRGGFNCRHIIIPVSSDSSYSKDQKRAAKEIEMRKKSGRYKQPETVQQYYERTKN